MRRMLLVSMLAALAVGVLGASPAAASVGLVVAQGEEAVPLEEGTPVEMTATNFKVWWSPYPAHCKSVQVTGNVLPDATLVEAEGQGEGCGTSTPWGTYPAELQRVDFGTVEFFEGGSASLSALEVDGTFSAFGSNRTCSWAAEGPTGVNWFEPEANNWTESGGARFDLGAQWISSVGFGPCEKALVEGQFKLSLPDGTPVHLYEN